MVAPPGLSMPAPNDAESSAETNTAIFADDAIRISTGWATSTSSTLRFYTLDARPIAADPLATLTIVHGLGEHIRRYEHVFAHFARRGIAVHGYDQRGFGRTAEHNGRKGHAGGWDCITQDIEDANDRVRHPNAPHFVLGHSMGGLNVLRWAERYAAQGKVAGVISSAPAIRPDPSVAPSRLLYYAASILCLLIPWFPMRMELGINKLCRDPAVVQKYASDPYNLDFATLQTIKDILDGGEHLLNETTDVSSLARTPLLIAHGAEDITTCPKSSRLLFDRIPASADKAYRSWDALLHELHNEPEKQAVLDDYADWILSRVHGLNK